VEFGFVRPWGSHAQHVLDEIGMVSCSHCHSHGLTLFYRSLGKSRRFAQFRFVGEHLIIPSLIGTLRSSDRSVPRGKGEEEVPSMRRSWCGLARRIQRSDEFRFLCRFRSHPHHRSNSSTSSQTSRFLIDQTDFSSCSLDFRVRSSLDLHRASELRSLRLRSTFPTSPFPFLSLTRRFRVE